MNADGSNLRNLTNYPSLDALPAWSPNGARIAFVSDRAGKHHREIFAIPSNGGHVVRITHTLRWATAPDWQDR